MNSIHADNPVPLSPGPDAVDAAVTIDLSMGDENVSTEVPPRGASRGYGR